MRRPRRAARLQCRQIADELPCAVFPGPLERKIPAGFAGHAERTDAGAAKILVERTDGVIRNHIQRPRYRERRDRRTASECFELHATEGVGAARKYKDVP